MKFSARTRYAVRILLELAQHRGKGPLPASQLAQHTGISIHFIEQILRPFKQAKIIRSVRGASGGHVLEYDPEHISLGDVLRTVEGGIGLTLCSIEPGSCPRQQDCCMHQAWVELSHKLEDEMNAISLKKILNRGVLPLMPPPRHPAAA